MRKKKCSCTRFFSHMRTYQNGRCYLYTYNFKNTFSSFVQIVHKIILLSLPLHFIVLLTHIINDNVLLSKRHRFAKMYNPQTTIFFITIQYSCKLKYVHNIFLTIHAFKIHMNVRYRHIFFYYKLPNVVIKKSMNK